MELKWWIMMKIMIMIMMMMVMKKMIQTYNRGISMKLCKPINAKSIERCSASSRPSIPETVS